MAMETLKEFNKVREEIDRYRQLNSQLKDRLVSLDAEIAAAEKRLQKKLTVSGDMIKNQQKHQRDRHRIRVLENELHQDTIKFNKLMCSNAALRKDIAHLQQQKVRGRNIQVKLNKELAEQQSTAAEVTERLSNASNQKSKVETQMQKVTESIEAETLDFNKKRMELKTAIHHEAKLNIFMKKKLQKVVPLEEDEDSKKRPKHLQDRNRVEKVKMSQQADSTPVVQDEQSNITYINYINEQHNKLNMLKRAINKRKSDILFLEQEDKRREEQDAHELQDLESELEKYGRVSDSLEKQHTVVEERLDQLKTGIASLYAEIMQTPITVTSDNIVHTISVIEERIIDLMMKANCVRYNELKCPPEKLFLVNFDLLPEIETAEEKESRKPCPSLLKFALSDGK